MEKKIVSIIIPIYKTEKYLRRCIESVLEQTYKKIEVILVNDGSPDNSLNICEEYEKKDSRVHIVNKKNGGLSSARNAGILVATGDYITFLDSDDYLKLDAIESLFQVLEKTNADISYIHETIVNDEYQIVGEDYNRHSTNVYTGKEFITLMCERKVNCAAWGKLFKKSLFEAVIFNEKRLNEDFLLLSEMLLTKHITIAEDIYSGYFYLERKNSISRCGFGKSSRDAVINTEEMKYLAQEKMPDMVPYYGAYALYQARTALVIMTHEQYCSEKEFILICRNVIRDNMKYARGSFISFKDQIFCQVYLLLPRLTIRLVQQLRGKT